MNDHRCIIWLTTADLVSFRQSKLVGFAPHDLTRMARLKIRAHRPLDRVVKKSKVGQLDLGETNVEGIGVVNENKNYMRNCWALDAALWFWCMARDSVIVVEVFGMADHVIAFLSGADDTYETTRTAT
ncbi:hypothetical protein Syun_029854 [Stephania yunnanensis]|uniref:Uncharacterized protein n=1 Tax=Stephania yunnanensis TaxID=152371 RepID=A0AAP0E670_9MAGN